MGGAIKFNKILTSIDGNNSNQNMTINEKKKDSLRFSFHNGLS